MTLALRITAISAASAQDVRFVGAEQRHGFTMNLEVTAFNTNLELLRIDCNLQRGDHDIDFEALAEAYSIHFGGTYTAEQVRTFVSEFPTQDQPMRLRCEGHAVNDSGLTFTAQDEEVINIDDTQTIGWGGQPEDRLATLWDERFWASVGYFAPDGSERQAHVMSRTDDRLVFYYDVPGQAEMIVQIINQCQARNRYSVFIGGPTPWESQVVISDKITGARRRYFNPMNQEATELRDTEGFRCR